MSAYDQWDVVALAFFLTLAALFAVYALVRWVDSRNPMHATRRKINGRQRMATDWRRPSYLPESWQ